MKPSKANPFRFNSKTIAAISIAFMSHLTAPSASAATYYWDSNASTTGFGSTTGTWGTNAFWSTVAGGGATHSAVTATVAADIVNFGTASSNYGNATVGIATGGVTATSIVIGAGQTTALTVGTTGGGAITLGGTTRSIVMNSDDTHTAAHAINAPIVLTGTTLFQVTDPGAGGGTRSLTLGGVISSSATSNVTFRQGGSGSNATSLFILNGANTYTGTTLIESTVTNSNAEVRLGVNDALPTTTVLTIGGVAGTGSGRVTSFNMNGKNQTLAGLATTGGGALRTQRVFSSAAAILTVNDNSARTFAGLIGSGGTNISVVKGGTGTWTLSGANSYIGSTTLNQGTITVGTGGSLGASTSSLIVNNTNTGVGTNVVLNLPTATDTTKGSLSGTIATPSSGTNTATINTQTGRAFIVNQTNAGTYPGVIAGAGGFTLGGSSTNTLTLSGLNTLSGNVTVSAGTLVANNTETSGNGPLGAANNTRSITVASGATLQLAQAKALKALFSSSNVPSLIINGTVNDTNLSNPGNNPLGNVSLNSGTLNASVGNASGYGSYNLNGTVTSTGTSLISSTAVVPITLSAATGENTTFDVTSGTLTISAALGQVTATGDEKTSSLTKAGAGTLVLSGTNTYSGVTTLSAGALVINGSNSSSSVTLSSGTLTGSGTAGAVNVANSVSAIVSNNNGNPGAPLTTGALTFSGAATVNTFSNSTSAAIITSSLATNAAGTVTINPTAASWPVGTYELISYGGGSVGGAGAGQFVLGTVTGASARQSKILGDSTTAITLTIGADDAPYWTGDGDEKWNLASSSNWKLLSNDSTTVFLATDNVLFNDLATGTGPITVEVDTADVAPNTTTFNNTAKDYILSGTFGIASGSLTKNGTGSLTISNANTYSGGTAINAGTITLSGSGTLGAGSALTLGGGTLDLGTFTTSVGGVSVTTPAASGDTILNGSLTGTSYAVSNASGNVGISANLLANGAAGLTKSGAGTLTLTGTGNSYTGTTTISAGSLVIDDGSIASSSGIVNNASLEYKLNSNASSYANIISGTGSLTKRGTNTLTLTGANTFTGNTTISAGTLNMGANRISGSPTIFIGDGATLQSSAGLTLSASQAITGTGTSGFVTTSNTGLITTSGTTISTSGTLTFSRLDVRGAGNVISGGNILSGSTASGMRGLLVGNAVTSTLTITGGTLTSIGGSTNYDTIGNTNAAGAPTGTLTINGGAYVNTANNGRLLLGNTGSLAGSATLNLTAGSATINTLEYNLGSFAGNTGTVNLDGGTLTVSSIVSSTGTNRIFNFNGGQLTAGANLPAVSNLTLNVKDGGANINTNGFSFVIGSPLLNDGTGGLTKSGLGTLTLSGANTYVGGTSVTGGALRFSTAAVAATDVTIATGAEAGALVATTDGQWVNTGNLTLQNNGAALVDYGSTTPSITVAPISVTDFANGTTPGVKLAGSALSSLAVGQDYPLATWTGTGPVDGSAFDLRTHRLSGTFSVSSNTLFLTITSNAIAPISWNTGNGNWDTSTTNWEDSNLAATTYFDTLDSVVFGDAAGVTGDPIVTLAATTSPLGVTMNTAGRNYTVSGAGSISGSGALTLAPDNSGTLTLATANNSFSGGTTVNGGTLALGDATNTLPNTGAVVLDGATAILSLGANSDTVGAVSLKNGASITGSGTLTGASYALESGSVSALLGGSGALAKTTSGTVTLSGANTSFTGATGITGGTLRLADTGALASTSNIGLSNANTRLEFGTDNAFTTLPQITGGSNFTHTIVSDRATAGTALSHQLGTINFGASTFNFIQGTNATSGTAGFTFGSATMTSGSAGTTILNPTTATLTVMGGVTSSGNVARTLQLAGTGTGNSVGGVITQSPGVSALSLTKSSTSTWTLSGANTYTGGTTVTGGTLVLGNGSALGTASASVTGGTLDLGGQILTNAVNVGASGTLTGSGNIGAATLAGTVTPGGSGSGLITFASASVASTSSINLQLAATGTRGTDYDAITVSNALALDGTITVSLNGLTPAGGQSFDLIDSTGPINVTNFTVATDLILPVLGAGLAWDTSTFATDGVISIVTTDPYLPWAASKGLTGGNNAKSADPDDDGKNNLYEFAFDGNPLSGADDGKFVGKIATVGTDQVLTLTLPVRTGAAFSASGGDQLSALIDAITYRIEGDETLVPFADAITEVTGGDATTIQTALPTLSTGWTYRTFRAPGTVQTAPKSFLRAKVSDTP